MGRLIDADKVYNDLIDNIDYLRNQNYDAYSSVGDTIQFIIDQQPTAYDVDKVVKELEEWSFNADVNVGDGTIMNQNLIARDNAIEIVKAGGKNDNNL